MPRTKLPLNAEKASNPDLSSEAEGIVQLIRSAQTSVKYHYSDDFCTQGLMRCIERIKARYAISQWPVDDEEVVVVETSVIALLRLLVYLQTEVTEQLGDPESGRILKACIEHLTRQYILYPQQDLSCAACTSH